MKTYLMDDRTIEYKFGFCLNEDEIKKILLINCKRLSNNIIEILGRHDTWPPSMEDDMMFTIELIQKCILQLKAGKVPHIFDSEMAMNLFKNTFKDIRRLILKFCRKEQREQAHKLVKIIDESVLETIGMPKENFQIAGLGWYQKQHKGKSNPLAFFEKKI